MYVITLGDSHDLQNVTLLETMDAFGDDFTGMSEVADIDPAAEFLAREHDQLAGLEDLIPAVSQPEPVEATQGRIMFLVMKDERLPLCNLETLSIILYALRIDTFVAFR